MKVMVTADGSRVGWKAIDFIARNQQMFGPRPSITLVHVDEGNAERVMRAARTRLNKKRLKCEERILTGKAGQVIANLARRGKYDLIVMSSHGYGAIEQLLLGSVPSRVLAMCKTPVLLVR